MAAFSKSMTFNANLLPKTTSAAGTIGTPNQKWDAIYATNLYGNADTATKLQTARSINLSGNLQGSTDINFDGSDNVTITALNYQASIKGGNKANYPWHRIATVTAGTGQYVDRCSLIRIRHTYNNGAEGLLKISVRTNATGSDCQASAIWLYRFGMAVDSVRIGLWGLSGDNVYADVYYKCATYPRAIVEMVSSNRVWTLINSNEVDNTTETDKKTSTDVYTSAENGATILYNKDYTFINTATDGGIVKTAASATNADTVDNLHASDFVRAYGTVNAAAGNSLDSDWGQSFRTFDPAPTGTVPENSPNISLISIGNNWNRRKMLAFTYNNDNIYYRRKTDSTFSNWVKLLHSGNYDSYALPLTGGTLTGQLYINYTQDAGLNQNGSLIIGNKAGQNIVIDDNEIMSRNNSAASTLYLNADGGTVSVGGYTNTTYALSAASFICNDWIRTVNNTGWYNQTHAGGWFMQDATWIRNYNNKQILVSVNQSANSSPANLSSQLVVSSLDSSATANGTINSTAGKAVAIELWRGSNASWQIANEAGVLYFRNNYTTAKQTTYNVTSLILDYNTGAGSIPYLAVGQSARNTSYKLFVNGTSALRDTVSFGYDATDKYLLYTGELKHSNHGATINLYSITAGSTAGASGQRTLGLTIDVDSAGRGHIKANGRGTNWNNSNTQAMIIMNTQVGWSPLWSIKANTGWWTMGHFHNANYDDALLFGFLADNDVSGVTGSQNHLDQTVRIIKKDGDRAFVTAPFASGKAKVGSTTKPIYISDEGIATEVSYSLNATIDSGTANTLAYYSGTNSISSASSFSINTAKGDITITSSAGNLGSFIASRTNGPTVWMGVGSGNVNHGLYSATLGKWMVYSDDSKVYLNGNAATATKLETARTISLTGSVTGSGSFDGSGNLSISTTTNHTHNYLTIKGTNTITTTDTDTTANWGAQGASIHWYSATSQLNDQPNQWGYLFNIGQSSEVHQMWFTQSSGTIWHRGGNGSGWNGTWRAIVDSTNFTSYITPAGIGAAASSHSHSYLPTGGGTMTGGITMTSSGPYIYATASGASGGLGIRTGASGAYHYFAFDANGDLKLDSVKVSKEGHTHSYLPLSGGELTGGICLYSTGAGNGYSRNNSCAIEVKEVNQVGSAQSAWDYAPKIGFRWSSRVARTLGMNSSGEFCFCGQNTSDITATIRAGAVYGAVWNDYAEYRQTVNNIESGQCVVEVGDGSLKCSTQRLQPGANIVSDTYGFAIGETSTTKTPLAVSGRVLAYPYEDRYSYQAGDPVCSGPNGTISKMTREEVREYPDRIIGTVSEIPQYETWGTGNVKVNGRIWIRIK